MKLRTGVSKLSLVVVVALLSLVSAGWVQGKQDANKASNQDPKKKQAQEFPDLVAALKATRGCLGVEAAKTASGKNVIFAWFEDKQAVLRWYYSDTHQSVMHMTSNDADQKFDKPLDGVPEDVGPIMAIASITFSDKPKFKDVPLPISQISIELYKPLTGGIFLGGRFAPDTLKVPGIKDYSPKETK